MNQTIQNSLGETLDYSFAPGIDPEKKSGWLVILGHGVTGNKDRPVIVDLANALNAAGYDTLRFSFAGNGTSEGEFRAATISKEVGDLTAVLDVAAQAYSNIVYVGHSMGGAVGVIQAAKDTRIHALVSLAGMIDTKAFATTEFGNEIPDQGCMWEEPDCPLSADFMKDLCETIDTLIPLTECIYIPWLLLHGTSDDVVQIKDTQSVEAIKGDAVTVVYIEGADHSFNEAAHKSKMIETVVDWVRQF